MMTKRRHRSDVQCPRCADYFPANLAGQIHLAKCHVYNGSSNYETWACALWLDNDEPTHRYWREMARECRAEAQDRDRDPASLLADRLKEEHDQAAHEWLSGLPGLFTDLLGAAMSEIDWREIAADLLAE